MALWVGLGQAATVAQLVGFDVVGIIDRIREAARTARQNKMNCELLAQQVVLLRDLLPPMERLQDPEAVQTLAGLAGTLEEAHNLVMSCQAVRCRLVKFCKASGMADRFRDVQNKIHMYLSIIPAISYVTRRLDGRDHRKSSSHSHSKQDGRDHRKSSSHSHSKRVLAAYSDSSEDDDIDRHMSDIRRRIMDASNEVDDLFDQNCEMMKHQSYIRFRQLYFAADKEMKERAAYSDYSEDDDIDSHVRNICRRIIDASVAVDDLFDRNCTKMKRRSHRRFMKLYNEIADDWAANKVHADSEEDGMLDVHWRIMNTKDEVEDLLSQKCKKMERRAKKRFMKLYDEIIDDLAADKKVKKAPRKK